MTNIEVVGQFKNYRRKLKCQGGKLAGGTGHPLVQTSDMGKKTVSVLAHLFLLPQRANSGFGLLSLDVL